MFSERFDEALTFAHQLHRRQRRKTSGVPYIGHPLGVASLVIEDGGSEDEAIAALLHDTLEDQGYSWPGGAAELAIEIERRFGPEVRRIVEACTERHSDEERRITDTRLRWRAHKTGYLEQIRSADPSVRRVSCADSLHNVRTMLRDFRRMGDRIWTRFKTRSGDDQVWAYRAMAVAFVESGGGPMAESLAREVEELARMVQHAAEQGVS